RQSSKSEARNPKEIRSPKPEPKGASSAAARSRSPDSLHSLEPASQRPTRPPVARRPRSLSALALLPSGGPARISDFGLLSDFGLRTSDFAHAPIPVKRART